MVALPREKARENIFYYLIVLMKEMVVGVVQKAKLVMDVVQKYVFI